MADNGVSFVLQSLNQLLEQDADLLKPEMEDQIRSLQSHLRQIISFSRQNEGRKNDIIPEVLVTRARSVIQEAELIIHTLAVDVAKQRMRSGPGKFFHFVEYTMKLSKAFKSLKGILTTIQDNIINELRPEEDHEIRKVGSNSFRPIGLRKHTEEDEVLGFDDQVKALVTKLTEGESGLEVIALVGRAGLGKTTLAKKVYSNDCVKQHFSCRAWVHVSENCGVGELLQKILEDAMPTMTEKWRHMKERKLVGELSECLQGMKYLIVMDNLCIEEIWEEVKLAFPDEGNGSRILLTTRREEAGDVISHSHKVCPLDDAVSWQLLKKIFIGVEGGHSHHKTLEELGRELVRKCEGSPLAIELLSGILATEERTEEAWSRLSEYLSTSSKEDVGESELISNLLNYAHKSLAHNLSLCFLYFGMFPEGVEIPARQLIQLWIAEGFIQQKGSRKMEDLGEEYLEELVDLSLIQVATRRTGGGVKACIIHDIFQAVCISKGQNSKFFEVSHPKSIQCGLSTRRLAIHARSTQDASVSHFAKYSDVRSFQLCIQDDDANLLGRQWSLLNDGFKLLRVLNLGFVYVLTIPSEVGKFIHLRYLKIRSPGSKHVPPSLCNLLNLQTLDLRESRLSSLPKGIWKLQQLRHLYLSYLPNLPELAATDKNALGSLQTLSPICPNKVTKRLMMKAKFPNLRRLKLFSQSEQETVEFLKSIDHLFHLQSLKIVSPANLPDPNAFPLTLTKITLLETCLSADSMEKLERLPNLQILKLLRNSVAGEEIQCSDDGFPQLQVLKMVELQTVRWKLGNKAMGGLRHLFIRKCDKLTLISNHMLWPSMREVDVILPSATLRKTLQQFVGKKSCSVRIHPPQDLADNA